MAIHDTVAAIFRETHIDAIDFNLNGSLAITPAELRRVGTLFADRVIPIEVVRTRDAPATYRIGRDALVLRSDVAAQIGEDRVKALIVHEGVHALMDLHRCTQTTGLTSEAAGIIAQVIYTLKSGHGVTRQVMVDAEVLIRRHRMLERRGVVLSWADYADFRLAVQRDPAYRGIPLLALAGYNGIRRR
jgi:hypothetical protein